MILHCDDASTELSGEFLRHQSNVVVVFERQSRAKYGVLLSAKLHNHIFLELRTSSTRRSHIDRNSHRSNGPKESRKLFCTAFAVPDDCFIAGRSHAVL